MLFNTTSSLFANIAQTPSDGLFKYEDETIETVEYRTLDLQNQINNATKTGQHCLCIPPGVYRINQLVIPDMFRLTGCGRDITKLLVPTWQDKHFVVSEKYDSLNGKFRSAGLPQGIEIRDIGIVGQSKLQTSLLNSEAVKKDWNTIHLYATSAVLKDISVCGVDGNGIYITRGNADRIGPRYPTDREEFMLDNINVQQCAGRGIHVTPSDINLRGIVISHCGGGGLFTSGGGVFIIDAHIFWCKGWMAELAGRTHCGILEVETGEQGLLSRAEGTSIGHFRAFGINGIVAQLEGTVFIPSCDIDFGTGIGLDLLYGAKLSKISGSIASGKDAIAIRCNTIRTKLSLDCWGTESKYAIDLTNSGHCDVDLTGGGYEFMAYAASTKSGNSLRILGPNPVGGTWSKNDKTEIR